MLAKSKRKGERMENLKLNVRALAAIKKISIEDLAREAGLDPSHLKSVSSGRATMTATDIINLSLVTGVSPFNIEH